MKKVIIALTISVLVVSILFSTNPIRSILSDGLARREAEVPSDNIGQISSADETQNLENHEDNVDSMGSNIIGTDSSETKGSQSGISSENSCFQPETSQGVNDSQRTSPPDGAIYYGGESPYAYLPTWTPKEFGRLPIVPIEPEG